MHAFVVCPLLLTLSNCTADGDDGGLLEFNGEQPLLPGLNVDTGWVPETSPASVRTTVTAGGGINVVATASTDGSSMTPTPGSGELIVSGGLNMEVSAKIDTSGIAYEGVVESFEYAIAEQRASFDPWALGTSVTVNNELPAQELGSVPIPSVPGASLVFSVTGGTLTTTFEGTCAEASGGFGQYAGVTTSSGTVEAAATIVIEIPIVGEETFGPFEFSVAIPELRESIDLGTRSLSDLQPADDRGLCADGGDGDGDPTGDGDGDPTGDGDGDPTGDGDGDPTGDGDGDPTGDGDGDPTGCSFDTDCNPGEVCMAGECVPA